jgi:taurine--2-oxoglutarate transaminase
VISEAIHNTFGERVFPGGLTYSGHPLACAAGVASIEVFERDNILEHVRDLGERVIRPTVESWVAKHPSLGEARGGGLFWALELVKSQETREPFVPYNASGPDAAPMMQVVNAAKAVGVWPFVHFNRLHIVPPLTITEEELREGLAGFEAALDAADALIS